MSMNKELNARLFNQNEEQRFHVEYHNEFGYYENIAEGNIDAVREVLTDPKNVNIYEKPEYGRMSNNHLRNIRYHFIVSVALITRTCVNKGLDRELAYTLSDLYIGKMDMMDDASQILSLHNEMILDFTQKMAYLPKQQIQSIQIVKAIEYICNHRNERITADTVSLKLGINRSYLSSLFKKETGTPISEYIRDEKLKAVENMLKFSDFSYGDIADYFGFASQSHLIRCFKKFTGLTPKQYRVKYYNNCLTL